MWLASPLISKKSPNASGGGFVLATRISFDDDFAGAGGFVNALSFSRFSVFTQLEPLDHQDWVAHRVVLSSENVRIHLPVKRVG